MSLKRLLWVLPVVLVLAFAASADTASVYFNGGYAFGNNGYGIPPYQGTLNGNSANFFCVDFSHDIYANTGWTANVTNLSSASFASTLQGSQADYQAFVYLISEMMGTNNQTQKAEYQWAIWSLSGGGDPYGTDATLWNGALNYVALNPTYALNQGWEVLTSTGSYGQEFLVQTPEPSSGLLLGIGVLGLLGMAVKKLMA
jgi:hypothetical protein